METNNLLAPLFFVLIRLMGGAILKFGLKKMPLPYTVGLFAFGLLIGTFDRIGWLESIPILKSSIDFAGNANPDMILYIFHSSSKYSMGNSFILDGARVKKVSLKCKFLYNITANSCVLYHTVQ